MRTVFNFEQCVCTSMLLYLLCSTHNVRYFFLLCLFSNKILFSNTWLMYVWYIFLKNYTSVVLWFSRRRQEDQGMFMINVSKFVIIFGPLWWTFETYDSMHDNRCFIFRNIETKYCRAPDTTRFSHEQVSNMWPSYFTQGAMSPYSCCSTFVQQNCFNKL